MENYAGMKTSSSVEFRTGQEHPKGADTGKQSMFSAQSGLNN